VRAYLAEFLADPRVVELPRLLWLPILHGVVLRARPARSAAKYARIWTAEGSPLAVHTRRQAELLGAALPGTRVACAMRYGEPSIAAALAGLADCEAKLVVPLYPQYARSTAESVRDRLPAGTPMLEHFHDHPAYIGALAAGIRRHWQRHGRGERLVLSFHGLPRRAVERGDPYLGQCNATARLVARALGLADSAWLVAFQSRFGPARWLEPYTEPTLVALARAGVKTVDVACPGFVSDCLETLEEIGIEAKEAFAAAGGAELRLVPCLNEDPEWIEALARIVVEGRPAP
jgi:ferrochelatase